MLTRIESDDVYDVRIENTEYWLYNLEPPIRSYLEGKMTKKLEAEYGEAFSRYYLNFLANTCNEWGKQNHVLSIARFNIIAESEDNDFDRAIELTNTHQVGANISRCLGLIFSELGMYSKALEYHSRSREVHEELSDRVGMSAEYTNMA